MAAEQTFTLPIQNMTCGGCAARVSRALSGVAGLRDVHVNFAGEAAQFAVDDASGLDRALTALDEAGYPATTQKLRFEVSGLSCGACVSRLQNTLQNMAGVRAAQVNLADETAQLEFIPDVVSVADLTTQAAAAGYPMSLGDEAAPAAWSAEKDAQATQHLRAVIIAASLTLPVFISEMGGHMFPAWHHLIARTIGIEASWMIQWVLTTLVLFGPGRGFFTNGFPALWRRVPNMNSLVALGAGSAWLFSIVALFLPDLLPQGTRAVYFEAAAVIVTLILLGRWFEARAKGRTGAAIKGLIDLQPPVALIEVDGGWRETPVTALAIGDRFLLRPGARVPTDATLVEGAGRVDESMLTGEPMPVAKSVGDPLTGGSVNGTSSLVCAVSRIGQDTTLAQIIRMVQQAQSARLPIQALVDRVTLWFVPAVMLVAMLTVAIWLVFGPPPALSYALVAGVSVLIIACPCAMGLATPTSIMVGTGRAAELGVLFRQGDALQSLEGVKVVALDKTGTLTKGVPVVTEFGVTHGWRKDEVLLQIAALETMSEHPVAGAIICSAQENGAALPKASGFQAHTGKGISGQVAGREWAIGTEEMMRDYGAETGALAAHASELRAQGQTVFFAQCEGDLAALISVSDPVRETSAQAVAWLRAQGMEVAMISGDAPATAEAVGRVLGIETVIAGVLPEGKVAALETLKSQFGKVAFVGDGLNDAPVLAEADVGIAIGTGTDVAIETADVVLMSGNLMGVTDAVEVSRSTLRNIKQNLVWAFGYNVLLIPVAAGAFFPVSGMLLSPGLAAGAMALSSVFVLGNALRLRGVGGA